MSELVEYNRMRQEMLNIQGTVVDGIEGLRYIGGAETKYRSSTNAGEGRMKYYTRGVRIMPISEWRELSTANRVTFSSDPYMPSAEWVILAAVNAGCFGLDRNIVTIGKSTMAVCGIEFGRVVSKYRSATGLSMGVYRGMEILEAVVNYRNGGVTIRARSSTEISLEDELSIIISDVEKVTDGAFWDIRTAMGSRYMEFAGVHEGQSYLDRLMIMMMESLHLKENCMLDVRRKLVRDLMAVGDDRGYWKEQLSGDVVSGGDGEWVQQAFKTMTLDLWNRSIMEKCPFTDRINFGVFQARALEEHVKMEAIREMAPGGPMQRLALNIPVERLSNEYYWMGFDKWGDSGSLFMDLRIGLYGPEDTNAEGFVEDEWARLVKDKNQEKRLRELAIERWHSVRVDA